MICHKCDSEIHDNSKVCDFCGARIVAEKKLEKKPVDEAVAVEKTVRLELPKIKTTKLDASVRPAIFGKRVVNFIIDFLMTAILMSVVNDLFQIVPMPDIAVVNGDPSRFLEHIDQERFYLFICVSFIIYTFVLEFFFGKTIGKMITRTSVISVSGTKLHAGQLLLRAVVKTAALYYEPFVFLASYFFFFKFKGLHDQLSKTMVVEKNEL